MYQLPGVVLCWCAGIFVCLFAAAASVDTSCVSDAWLSAFLKASQPRLSAFEPVQLAHTANSLAIIARSQQDLNLGLVSAAWQGAFVQAAAQQLEAGRFGTRNLSVLVRSLQVNTLVVIRLRVVLVLGAACAKFKKAGRTLPCCWRHTLGGRVVPALRFSRQGSVLIGARGSI